MKNRNMTGSDNRIYHWIPGFSTSSRRGLSAIFSVFFYLVSVVLTLNAGNIARIGRNQQDWARGDLIVICAVLFILYAASVLLPRLSGFTAEKPSGKLARRFEANYFAVVGLVLLLAVLCAAVLAPLLTSYDPVAQPEPVADRYLPLSSDHPMGTDKFGRDILCRILYGARVSLSVGVISVILAAMLGLLIGAMSGYFGGWVDSVAMRIVDGFLAFPRLLLVLTLVALFSSSFALLILVIGGTAWMGIARVIRSEVLSLKEREFIEAARATGLGANRIVFRHLIPNSLGPALVAATLKIGTVIILESSLSFLGLGIQPPTPSWGGMVFEGREVLLSAWWVAAFPAAAIVLTVVACNLLGDGLRDALDVRAPV
ncbi:MAG: ABC transporter permease [Candidatus Latescibacterota bacterium]